MSSSSSLFDAVHATALVQGLPVDVADKVAEFAAQPDWREVRRTLAQSGHCGAERALRSAFEAAFAQP